MFRRTRDRVSGLIALYQSAGTVRFSRIIAEWATGPAPSVRRLRDSTSTITTAAVPEPDSAIAWVVSRRGEYEGDLAEFLPWLEAARWTGVGRLTVWGNGMPQVGPGPPIAPRRSGTWNTMNYGYTWRPGNVGNPRSGPVVFGPKELPKIASTIAKAMTEFRRAQNDLKTTFSREMENLERETGVKELTSTNYMADSYNYEFSGDDGDPYYDTEALLRHHHL